MIRIGNPGATFGLKTLALAGLAAVTLLPALVSPANADMPTAAQLAEMRARMTYRVGVAGLASTGTPQVIASTMTFAPPSILDAITVR